MSEKIIQFHSYAKRQIQTTRGKIENIAQNLLSGKPYTFVWLQEQVNGTLSFTIEPTTDDMIQVDAEDLFDTLDNLGEMIPSYVPVLKILYRRDMRSLVKTPPCITFVKK